MNHKVLGKRVLVALKEQTETVTSTGIILTDSVAKHDLHYGIVVDYGDTTDFIKGEQVAFGKYAGLRFNHEAKPHALLNVGDVLFRVS